MGSIDVFNIRSYQSGDLVPLAELWYEAWHAERPGSRHVYPIERWRELFGEKFVTGCTIWVATYDGRPVGYVALRLEGCHVDHIVVSSNYQRRGVGSLLIDQCKRSCPNGLGVFVARNHETARAFYTKNGLLETATVHQWRPPAR
jgi:ribosomal protein S18 acetylase RimI-like enzyme